MNQRLHRLWLLVVSLLWGACSASEEHLSPVSVPEKGAYSTLSEWNLFRDLPSLAPNSGVIPYEVISPLFSDYAWKHRFMYVPEGTQIHYRATEAWEFPIGSVLVKVFAYPHDQGGEGSKAAGGGERILETRLLIHRSEGWVPEVYVWNDEQTEAERVVSGELIELAHADAEGREVLFEYGVPTRGECRKCHGAVSPVEGALATRTLGPMTPQLNRTNDYGNGPENQVTYLWNQGLLDQQPEPEQSRVTYVDPADEQAPLGLRARSYLASNCSNCHAEHGEALDKRLWLDFAHTVDTADPYGYGVCKRPTSAGNAECSAQHDVVPGQPEDSLLICRMQSVGKGQMPPLGRNLVHAEGAALIAAWVESMTFEACTVAP